MEALHLFQETGVIPTGCNASFIVLVPKVSDPLSLDQFRPISLVGIFYKIVTKVLAGRMKEVLSLVIDENQYAFLKNKGMLDSVLMANEVVEEVRRNHRSTLCFKVDYEKAYDLVRWDFLLDMLQRLGFHSKWVRWVRGCLELSSISVLINGSPTEEFKPSRGLRQGDPMAPFLFLVVAEGLAGLVRQASKQNMLTGLNVDKFTLETYAKTLNCNTMWTPFKYLGLEVGGNPRKGRDNRSIPWVSWGNICRPPEEGGLGIKDIRKFNYALMAKWKWRLMSDEKGKWKDIMESKYMIKSGISSVRPCYHSWWWRDLEEICREGNDVGWFQQAVTWNVRSGDLVRFWEDPWVNNNNLKELYPRLFSLSLNQEMTVGETGFWDNHGWHWHLKWRRERFHWESILEEELLAILSRGVLYKDSKDFIT
ncbi:uncharacterized protein [Phaseolus vulgaris]|uniref:uncharacterized protein n=1 Tax=Phaseolus vulgaris TaxID=3885 RepID=UPI0035CA7C9C